MSTERNPDAPWWKRAVIYQLLPATFYDANGDGTGDLNGIIRKLDYLVDLGIDAIWIAPVYASPMFDMGYDVSDYRSVNPLFGTLTDLDRLLAEAHKRGVRIILDMVINHTSDNHPWFQESRSSLNNPKRDWYIWHKGRGGRRPNRWKSVYSGSAWEKDILTGHYYYHTFFKQQPDLNWRNPEVRTELLDTLRFWLNRGVDGFRLDAVNMIIKEEDLRKSTSLVSQLLGRENHIQRNRPESFEIVGEIRKLADEYGDRLIVGEIYMLPPGQPGVVTPYLEGKKLHMAFDFSLIFRRWAAVPLNMALRKWMAAIPPDAWACHVFSNHDLNRSLHSGWWHRKRDERAKMQAMLLLTLKGTPFLYYGEEIGMRNGRIARKWIRDPLGNRFWPLYGGRDRARTPMQWTGELNGGGSPAVPYLPVNPDFRIRNVSSQSADPNSVLNFYKRLIRYRKSSDALVWGSWTQLYSISRKVMAYLRVTEGEKLLILLNISPRPVKPEMGFRGPFSIVISTHRNEGDHLEMADLRLFAWEASLIRADTGRG